MAATVWVQPGMAGDEKEFLPPAPEGKQWKLVWHGEFDGAKLDESKWDETQLEAYFHTLRVVRKRQTD